MPSARITLYASFFRRLGFFSAMRFHASLISACRSGVTRVRFAFMARARRARDRRTAATRRGAAQSNPPGADDVGGAVAWAHLDAKEKNVDARFPSPFSIEGR